MILGIDEVGRGPWAGPLVVGAVVLSDAKIEGLADSKQLSKKKRESLCAEILASDASVGLGWVSTAEIDEIGLSQALKKATAEAVAQIKAPYHEIIIDGTVNFLSETGKGKYVTLLKKADQLIQAVSAASIVAKVARDDYMAKLDEKYPGYGFADHVGYGTAKHRAAIEELGPCPEHRMSVRPLHKYKSRSSHTGVSSPRTTKRIGDTAESKVCDYLEANGYEVLARNWKTKVCEIDIVAAKDEKLYFVEVKYRKDAKRGGGVAAITPKKLQKMEFAAKVYAHHNQLDGADLRLAVADVSGESYEIKEFLILS